MLLQSTMTAIEGPASHADYAGVGAFNDPGMLLVGLEGMEPYGVVRARLRSEHTPATRLRSADPFFRSPSARAI